jgi:hypothetical protein
MWESEHFVKFIKVESVSGLCSAEDENVRGYRLSYSGAEQWLNKNGMSRVEPFWNWNIPYLTG